MDGEPQQSPDPPGDGNPPVLSYAPSTSGRMELLATFPGEVEAHLAAGLLESRGLECKVVTKLPTYAIGPFGAALLVAHRDKEDAVDLLAHTPARSRLLVPPSDLPPAKVMPVEVCSQCGSAAIGSTTRVHWIVLTAAILGWLPWVITDGKYLYIGVLMLVSMIVLLFPINECRECGARWRSGDQSDLKQ